MIPDWMTETEIFEFHDEKKSLLDRNKRGIRKLLERLQCENRDKEVSALHPGVQLGNTLVMIVALCLSHSLLNVIIIAVYEGLFLVMLRGDTIWKILKMIAFFTLLNVLFCLPTLFFGQLNLMFIIKNMFIFLAINMYMETTTFYSFLTALRKFHLPNMMIFQLDILIRYLHVLGQL